MLCASSGTHTANRMLVRIERMAPSPRTRAVDSDLGDVGKAVVVNAGVDPQPREGVGQSDDVGAF